MKQEACQHPASPVGAPLPSGRPLRRHPREASRLMTAVIAW
ncbi:hypothetical protein [Archangium violaceum]|nr:hypothetical protein [Archangium violaceum]